MEDDGAVDDSAHGENEEGRRVQPHPSAAVHRVDEQEAQDLPGPSPLSDEAVHGGQEREAQDRPSPHLPSSSQDAGEEGRQCSG